MRFRTVWATSTGNSLATEIAIDAKVGFELLLHIKGVSETKDELHHPEMEVAYDIKMNQ